MKPSRRTNPRRTTSRRTTSHSTHRDAREDLAANAFNSPQHALTSSEDPLGATAESPAPLSFQSGAGRHYWDEVLRLLVNIRVDCDAAAERLGYASAKDDGLAAVEYIAHKILDAVRGERQQQIANAKKSSAKQQSAAGRPEVQPPAEARHKSDWRTQPAQPAAHSERSKLIGELKQMLRDGKTKAGVAIDPPLAHEIAKHITILNEETPETQSIKRIRDSLAIFGKGSGDRKTPSKGAAAAVTGKRKPTKTEPPPAKKSVTKGSKRRSR